MTRAATRPNRLAHGALKIEHLRSPAPLAKLFVLDPSGETPQNDYLPQGGEAAPLEHYDLGPSCHWLLVAGRSVRSYNKRMRLPIMLVVCLLGRETFGTQDHVLTNQFTDIENIALPDLG